MKEQWYIILSIITMYKNIIQHSMKQFLSLHGWQGISHWINWYPIIRYHFSHAWVTDAWSQNNLQLNKYTSTITFLWIQNQFATPGNILSSNSWFNWIKIGTYVLLYYVLLHIVCNISNLILWPYLSSLTSMRLSYPLPRATRNNHPGQHPSCSDSISHQPTQMYDTISIINSLITWECNSIFKQI